MCALSVSAVVRRLMNEHEEFMIRPLAYGHRDRLFLMVESVLGRRVSPESVTRSQRKFWSELDLRVVGGELVYV